VALRNPHTLQRWLDEFEQLGYRFNGRALCAFLQAKSFAYRDVDEL
jgi:hypothetical protein